ncbi:MAG: signal peptide peptidase SppA [Deltaproteobacteria bacterium]|nr:signal peptide peptidase SppA [Deltaproteobacteria bacterium]
MKRVLTWFLSVVGFFLLSVGFFVAVVTYLSSESPLEKGNLALIEIEGPIYESKAILKQLEKVRKNDDFKAVVIRVNSPGGTVASSQEIHDAVLRLKGEGKKKVIVSMETVAASGGYYLSAPADWIVANPGTLTGSIGVRLQTMNLEDLMKWVHLKPETLKSGHYKDIGSPFRQMTPEERGILEALLKDMHGQFKEAVAQGRGLSAAEVDLLADGRVFSGREALEKKLVDQLGSLEAAVTKAGELAGIKGEPKVVTIPKEKRSILDLVLGEASGSVQQLLSGLQMAGHLWPVYLW